MLFGIAQCSLGQVMKLICEVHRCS